MDNETRELDLKVADLQDRVHELEHKLFKPQSDERKMECSPAFGEPYGKELNSIFTDESTGIKYPSIYAGAAKVAFDSFGNCMVGTANEGSFGNPSITYKLDHSINIDNSEVLCVTRNGEFIWAENASSKIKDGDFSFNPALKFILERLMAWEEAGWVLNTIDINGFQAKTLDDTIKQSKHAHMTDVDIRINGQNVIREADWIKHLRRK